MRTRRHKPPAPSLPSLSAASPLFGSPDPGGATGSSRPFAEFLDMCRGRRQRCAELVALSPDSSQDHLPIYQQAVLSPGNDCMIAQAP